MRRNLNFLRRVLFHPLFFTGLLALTLAFGFQNCDGGFRAITDPNELASGGGGGVGDDTFNLKTYDPSGLSIPDAQSLDGGVDYKIVASGTILSQAILSWSLTANTGSCVLKSGTLSSIRFVNCTAQGAVTIQASAILNDGSTKQLSVQRNTKAIVVDNCGSPTPTRVPFRISLGTGSNPWNTVAAPQLIFVGQTLRICNDDTGPHRLRTPGAPCPQQPADMANGQIYDCPVTSATGANPTTGIFPGLYDFNVGAAAAFYVRVLDGQALYNDTTKTASGQNCASCHNAFAASAKKGASFSNIKAAIMNNTGGMGTYSGRITDDELKAVAFALSL